MQNYIIIVLCILLAITLTLYITLLNKFDEFQKQRMCYIKTKTAELDEREKHVMDKEKCQSDLSKAQIAIGDIENIAKNVSTTQLPSPQPEKPTEQLPPDVPK